MRYVKFLIATWIMVLFFCGVSIAEIAIGPLTKTVQVAAGKSATVAYKVANKGKEAVNITISGKNWFVLAENADIPIEEWLSFKADKVTLAPKQEKDIKFTVTVPKRAKGELAAMIYFTPEKKEAETIGTSYGVSLYAFVKGTEKVEVEIALASINKSGGDYYLSAQIRNNGNVHFRPKVSAVVKAGEAFEENVVFPFGKPIYGRQSFTFMQLIRGRLPDKGICTVEVSCNYGDSEDTIVKKTFTLKLEDVK